MQKLENAKIDELISDKKIPIRLAYLKPSGVPSVLSLWYVEIGGKIFCATQKSAKIVSYLQNNPSCGFEIAGDKPPYKGARGEGKARIVEERGNEILQLLIDKYLGKKDSTLSKFLKIKSKSEVAIEITPKKIFHYDYTNRMKDI
ncbi:MAG: pyridoxamine 5'-phosphate oxidase family protein [Nitrosopumilaceae archaeon]